jgi:hypothetical protein
LIANDLKAQNVVLGDGFKAAGMVSLIGAALGDKLDCDGHFNNPNGTALNADDLKARNVFLESHFEATGTVDLDDATVSGVLGDQKKGWPTPGHLTLDGFIYGGFKQNAAVKERLRWLTLQPTPLPPQPYEQLANVLRANSDDSGARTVLITMERKMRSQEAYQHGEPLRSWTLLWSWILWATIGYGYSTWRAVVFSAILVLFGAFYFTYGNGQAWIISTEEHPESYTPFSGIIYSLETLLPFVDLYQAKHWVPNAQTRGGRTLRRYLWVHTLLGWFFASMILAGLSGVVQK